MDDPPGREAWQYHFDPTTYLEMVVAEVPAYFELQDLTAELAAGYCADQILELGVGTGETSARVLALHPSAHLTGIDESVEMVEWARRRLGDADLRVGRLEDPLPGGVYDVVVSALAVHHLDAEGKADLFRRVAERLRPGGRFVLADVVIPSDPTDATTPIDGVYDKPSRIDEQLRWLEAAALRARVAWRQRDLAILVAERA